MRRILITGVNGFLGSHLAEFCIEQGLIVYGVIHKSSQNLDGLKDGMVVLPCDVTCREQVDATIREARPDVVFHLAAQSVPTLSWHEPEATFRTNVFGTLHLLEAIRAMRLDPVVLVAGSSAEYGLSLATEIPLREDAPCQPANPYAISKVAQSQLAYLYWRTHNLRVVRVRPFNIIGTRKIGDACSDFISGVVAAERDRRNVMKVGNLEAVRDFVDVRDAAQALALVAETGDAGEVYNVCSGLGRSLSEVLEILLTLTDAPVRVEVDPARLRPLDEPYLVGNNTKLGSLGWSARTPLQTSLGSILESCREESRVGG